MDHSPFAGAPERAPAPDADDGWEYMIVEVFGHRRHAGRVREEERFGAKMLRVDVPTLQVPTSEAPGYVAPIITGWVTHYYGGSALFSVTPTDEAAVLRINRPYLRPAPLQLAAEEDDDGRPF